eukprot:6175753-Pleurochrysis_carterae.AAC.1
MCARARVPTRGAPCRRALQSALARGRPSTLRGPTGRAGPNPTPTRPPSPSQRSSAGSRTRGPSPETQRIAVYPHEAQVIHEIFILTNAKSSLLSQIDSISMHEVYPAFVNMERRGVCSVPACERSFKPLACKEEVRVSSARIEPAHVLRLHAWMDAALRHSCMPSSFWTTTGSGRDNLSPWPSWP